MKHHSKQEFIINKNAIANNVFSEPKKIIFIDSQVEDYRVLVAGVAAGIETVILDRHSDGIEKITSVLSQKRNIGSIHIVSHGSPGCLYLGNTSLSLHTLDKYQEKIKTWFNTSIFKTSLNNEGQGLLSLYGCNVAAGDAGEEFITKLNKLTGAEIAASTTPIGNTARGGNWDLDFCTNSQEKKLAFTKETQENYSGVFETVTYSNNDSESTIDNGTITKTFNVTDSLVITDINIGLNLAHDYRSALDITLQHPDGTTIELTTDNGGEVDNVYVLFDDEASVNITADQETHNTSGYSNLRIPEQALSAFDGKSSSGTWILTITDDDGFGDVGTYNDSQLVIEGSSNTTEESGNEKYSLGNQIWLDANNNGQIDDSEIGIDGVVVNLYSDSDNDGNPDGQKIATTTSSNDGYYRFDDLAAGDYIVEVEASNFEAGNALAGMNSSAVDEIEPNDDIDTNDNGIGTTPNPINGIRSNTVNLGAGSSEPLGETDVDPTFPSTISTTRADSLEVPATSTIRINAIDGADRGRFNYDANFVNRFVVDVTGYGENFTGFCLEFGEFIKANSTYTPVNFASEGTFYNSSYNDPGDIQNFFGIDPNADDYGIVTQNELDLISTVWANVDPDLLTDPDKAQGLQILIWELQNDQTFDLTSGNFFLDATGSSSSTVNANTANVIDMVNGWIDSVDSGAWTGSLPLALLSLEGNQDLIVNLDLGAGTTDSQSNLTVDFGFVVEEVAPTYKLSGIVLEDTNAPDADGIDNPGDTPIKNVIVELFADDGTGNGTGNAIASTATNANGYYEFTDLVNGDYVVVQTQPDGYESVTDIDAGEQDKILATINGADITGQNFLEETPLYKLSGTVLEDTEDDDAFSAVDTPIAGVTVELFANDGTGNGTGNAIASTATNANGYYEFTDLANGNYVVVESQPEGYESVTDIDAGEQDKILATINGADSTGNNFLEEEVIEEKFSLGNRIWLDANDNGQIDGSENGIDGVIVNLYSDSDNDGNPDGEAISTVTSSDGGYYHFDDLAAGDYIVEVEASNFEAGNALAGMNSSAVDEIEPNDDLEANDNGIGITPNPIYGIRSNTVTLASGSSESMFPSTISTTQTDSSEVPATSTIRINAIDGENRGRFNYDANFVNRFVVDVTGYGENLTGFCLEFGEFVKPNSTYTPVNIAQGGTFYNSSYNDPGDIQNFFGIDSNADNYGIVTQDELDLISTVWANVDPDLLTDPDQAQALQVLIWELQNDQTFDLTSGNFFLDATGSSSSTVNANTANVIDMVNGWIDSVDSGAWTGSLPLALLSLEGNQDLIVNLDLGAGTTDSQSDLTVDFGFTPGIAAIYKLSGAVFDDTQAPDAAEINNPGDTPIKNVTVELFADDGTGNGTGSAIASTTTNANGYYEFTDLASGDYVVVQTQPDGYESVTDIDGTDDNKILATIADSDVINQNFLEQVAVEFITGTNSNDYLYGTALNDYMDALEGNDTLNGSLGADILIGGDGSDMARYRLSDTSVNVDLANNTATGGDAEGDTFDSIENLSGSLFSDVLIGDDNNNKLYGAKGDDTLIGNDGNDLISGNNGNDSIEGGAGKDRLFGGSGNDNLAAGAGNDLLAGGIGDDILTGASLITNGVAEIDRFRGSWGKDTFVLGTDSAAFYDDGDNTSNGIADYAMILDFEPTEDVIQLSGTETYYLDANPAGTAFGTGVFIDNDGTDGLTPEDELVGLIRGSALTPGMIDDSTSGFVLV